MTDTEWEDEQYATTDDRVFVSVVDEATIKKVAQHGAMHQIGMCICPCFDALMTLSKSLPERDRMMKLEGVLSVVKAGSGS